MRAWSFRHGSRNAATVSIASDIAPRNRFGTPSESFDSSYWTPEGRCARESSPERSLSGILKGRPNARGLVFAYPGAYNFPGAGPITNPKLPRPLAGNSSGRSCAVTCPSVTIDLQPLSLTRGAGFVTVGSRPSHRCFALSAAFASNCEHWKSKRFWSQKGEKSVSALSHKGNAAVFLPRRTLGTLGFTDWEPGSNIRHSAVSALLGGPHTIWPHRNVSGFWLLAWKTELRGR